jgi:hypothetical protein
MLPLDDRIRELMGSCGAHTPPDYYRFCIELDELLSSGVGPRTLCASLAGHLERTGKAIQEFSAANEGVPPDAIDVETKRWLLGVFHGFKLLQAFIGRLPPEMRERIAEISGVPVMGPGDRKIDR